MLEQAVPYNHTGGYEVERYRHALIAVCVCAFSLCLCAEAGAQADDSTRDPAAVGYKLKKIKKNNLQMWITDVVVVGEKHALLFYHVSSYDDDYDELFSVTINHRGKASRTPNKVWEGPYDSRLASKAAWLPDANGGEGVGLLVVMRSDDGDMCRVEQARFDSDGILTENFTEAITGDAPGDTRTYQGSIGVAQGADGSAGVLASVIYRTVTPAAGGLSSTALFYETGNNGALPAEETPLPDNMKLVNIPGGASMQEAYSSNPQWTGKRWLFPLVLTKHDTYVDSEGRPRFRAQSNALYIGRVEKKKDSLKNPKLRKLTDDLDATYNSYRSIQFLPPEQASAPGTKPAYRLVYAHRSTLDEEDQIYGWYKLEIASWPINARGKSAGTPTMVNMPEWNHTRPFSSNVWWSSSFTTPSLLVPMSNGEYALGLTRAIRWILPDGSSDYENRLEFLAVDLSSGEVRELASKDPGSDYMFHTTYGIAIGGKYAIINCSYRFNAPIVDYDYLDYFSSFGEQ